MGCSSSAATSQDEAAHRVALHQGDTVCVRGSVTDFFFVVVVVAQIRGSVCPLKWEWERRLCLITCAYMYRDQGLCACAEQVLCLCVRVSEKTFL